MKIVINGFLNTMTKKEQVLGFTYLPVQVLLLPLLIPLVLSNFLTEPSDMMAKIICYGVGFVFCLAVMWRYLRGAFDILLDNVLNNIMALLLGYFLYEMMSYAMAILLTNVFGNDLVTSDEETISSIRRNFSTMFAIWVLLAPVVEEILFRGVLFGALRGKSRGLAYVVSILAFCIYNVWPLALQGMDIRILIYLLNYVPAGFVFCWSYEKTSCIWIPILLSMLTNGILMGSLLA